jgi:riboflavin synthase
VFTGLVEAIGTVAAVTPGDGAVVLAIATTVDPGELGASLAVDGVCLTVTGKPAGQVTATCGHETLECTTLGALRVGDRVNLERPLRMGDRLGGHMVSGHVDAVGRIAARTTVGEALDVVIAAPPELLRYVVEKGSIAVDGISLTVNHVDAAGFGVSLIPHTQEATTLADKAIDAGVNLEIDVIAKYVERLVGAFALRPGGILDK